MNYTPLAHLTNEELVAHVCNKEDPTDLELELMHRLEPYMDAEADERAEAVADYVIGVPV